MLVELVTREIKSNIKAERIFLLFFNPNHKIPVLKIMTGIKLNPTKKTPATNPASKFVRNAETKNGNPTIVNIIDNKHNNLYICYV